MKVLIAKIAFILLVSLIIYGCSDNIEEENKENDSNAEMVLNQKYFPDNTFTDSTFYTGYDSARNHIYSKHLRAMKEPILYTLSDKREVYRFLWLRTFHDPIAVRIEKCNDGHFVYLKRSDGSGGYESGNLILKEKKKIKEWQWKKFKNLLELCNYWEMKTNVTLIELQNMTDGAQWLLEGKKSSVYHVVDRLTLDLGEMSLFHDCCKYLLELTELKIDKDEFY